MENKRALVVNSGGAKGSWGAGIVNALKDMGVTHDIYVGCSTGSLIVTMAAADRKESLKDGYTNIGFKDVFTLSPFKVKKRKKGDDPTKVKYKLHYWNIFKNLVLRGKDSLGDHGALRNTIQNFFSQEDYEYIQINNRQLEVVVTNLTKKTTEYKNIIDCSYEDFCDWMWASAAAPPFMTIVEKNEYQYVDGGVLEMLPIERAIELGAKEIDIIVLNEKDPKVEETRTKNVLHYIGMLVDMISNNTQFDDEKIGELLAKNQDVKLNFYYTPTKLTDNGLIFEKQQMQRWYQEGYDFAINKNYRSVTAEKLGLRNKK